MKKIVLTGGGTAGHVTPHFALLPYFDAKGIQYEYIGSKEGIEKQLVEDKGIVYHPISSGKLRRYFDWKNFSDPFRIAAGLFQSIGHLKKANPDLVFSKGGFVSVPVVIAAWLLRIPVIIHESDMTPGLANKLSQPFAKKFLLTFEETLAYTPKDKGIYTGSPVRESLKDGNKEAGYRFTTFSDEKPVLMMMGGSIGSVKINNALRESLPELLKTFQIIHLCGKGNVDHSLDNLDGYRQYEFIGDELKDLFSITDIMLSRAGSNSINEFLYLGIPSLLIPLSKSASRGDQILNASAFLKKGFSQMLIEEEMDGESLTKNIRAIYENKDAYIDAIQSSSAVSGSQNIFNILEEYLD